MKQLLNRQTWQEALRLGHSQFLLLPALRETVGIVLVYMVVWNTLGPVAQSLALGAAAGALMAGLASVKGPSRTRRRILLAMTLLLGSAVALGLLFGEQPLLAAGVITLATFGFTMLAAANPLYQVIAVISISYMVTYAAQHLPAELWWSQGLAIVAGGLLQLFYLSWMWPLPPFQPEREQIAQVYRDVADAVRQLPGQAQPGLMLHHSAALAQAQVITVERYHPQWQAQQAGLTALLDHLYDLDAALTGLGVAAARWVAEQSSADDVADETAQGRPPTAAEEWLSRFSEQAAEQLSDFAGDIEQGQLQLDEEAWQQWQTLLAHPPSALQTEASSVLEAVQHLRPGAPNPQLRVQRHAGEPIWQELLRPWRDRHRVQFSAYYSLGIGAMTYFSEQLPWDNSSWLVMTYALIFGSDYQQLLTRGLARIAGTLAALALILLIQKLFGLNEALSAVLFFVASYLVVATVQAGYLAVSLAFTVYTFATMNSWEVSLAAPDRLWMTAGGVALAVLAYWIWPNWHVRNLPQRREVSVRALRNFMAAQRDFIALRSQGSAQERLTAANEMRWHLLKLGSKFRSMVEVAGASRSEPVWDEYDQLTPLEELELLEHLAAEATGIYAQLVADTVTPQRAGAALDRLEQRLSDLELSEVPQPKAPLVQVVRLSTLSRRR